MKKDNPKYCRCLRCNRKLKSEEAKKRGYGEHCWKAHKLDVKDKQSHLFVPKV